VLPPVLFPGDLTVPFDVLLSAPPPTALTVTLSCPDAVFTPSVLTWTATQRAPRVTLKISETPAAGALHVLNFALSGPDAALYIQPANVSLNIRPLGALFSCCCHLAESGS
jgi:hypothetical protein